MADLTTHAVLQLVSNGTGISVVELIGRSRTARVAEARQIAYWLLHNCGHSMNSIGKVFDRDHSTVSHGIAVISRRRKLSRNTRELTNRLFSDATAKPGRSLIDDLIDQVEDIRNKLVELKGCSIE